MNQVDNTCSNLEQPSSTPPVTPREYTADEIASASAAGRPIRYSKARRRELPEEAFTSKVAENEEYVVDPDLTYRERGPTQMTTMHRQIMYRLLMGHKPYEIFDDFKISRASGSIIIRSPLFRAELRRLELQMEERLVNVNERYKNAGPSAFNTIASLMKTSENERIKLDAAKYIDQRNVVSDTARLDQKRDHGNTVSLAWERRKRMLRANGTVEETVERVEQVSPANGLGLDEDVVQSSFVSNPNHDDRGESDPIGELGDSGDVTSIVLDSTLSDTDVRALQAVALDDEEHGTHGGEAAKLFNELMGISPSDSSSSAHSPANGNGDSKLKDAFQSIQEE